MACYEAGAAVRIFGDPMQRIYGSKKKAEIEADKQRWEHLKEKANAFEELDKPHRWADGSDALGQWILAARVALRSGAQIDLGGPLPQSVSIVVGENESPKQRGGYRLAKANAKPIYSLVKQTDSLLVLASHNETVNALRAFFGRQLPIWEGHVREGLTAVVGEVQEHKGDAVKIAHTTVKFLGHVATGFSLSAYGDTFLNEVSAGCTGKRNGKPATLQALGRLLLEEPNHRGIAKVLQRLRELITNDPAFSAVKIDYHREFWDAVRLAQFDDPDEGLAEISRRRSYARPSLPTKAISTIHKAKGLECRNVLILPCDAQHFAESPAARCRLYVAMSRPTHSLTFVVSQKTPSPLFKL